MSSITSWSVLCGGNGHPKKRYYSIKYAGIVNGRIGVLSRREPISPYCVTADKRVKRRIRGMSLEKPETNQARYRAKIKIPTVKRNEDIIESDPDTCRNGQTPSFAKTTYCGNRTNLIITQFIPRDSFSHKINELSQIVPALDSKTLQDTLPECPHNKIELNEVETGYPNPEKYNTPVVHTYAYGKQLYCSIRPTWQRRRLEFDSPEAVSCKEPRRGFSGYKIPTKRKHMRSRGISITSPDELNEEEPEKLRVRRWEVVQKEIEEKNAAKKRQEKYMQLVSALSNSMTLSQGGGNDWRSKTVIRRGNTTQSPGKFRTCLIGMSSEAYGKTISPS